MKRLSWSLLLVLLSTPLLQAQGALGTITGVVKDTSGAFVPSVEITITNKATGVVTKALTTEAGVYRAPYIAPGSYRVHASLPGFKTAGADNVEVRIAQVANVDFTLEVGEVSEMVDVVAPRIESASPNIGTDITDKEFHTWPIQVGDGTRQLQEFIFKSLPGTQGGTFMGSINGGQNFSHEIVLEGITLGRFDLTGGSNNEFTPSAEAVQEFKLQTGALSAQYGATQTAVANFSMKSGTNDLHGAVYWFHKDKHLAAKSWTDNAFNRDKAAFLENNVGAAVGGPIRLPGYNGRDRTHFHVSFEADRFRDQRAGSNLTLPSKDFKQGNFARLLDPAFTLDPRSGTVIGQDALGRSVRFGQIYDPASSRQLADGTWIRDPFPGNVVPQNRFSSISRKILELADTPDPVLNQFRNNMPVFPGCCPRLDLDIFSVKLDHVISNNHKMSSFYTHSDRSRLNGDRLRPGSYAPIPGSGSSTWGVQDTPGRIFRISEDWTISSTMLNHLAVGYNRFGNKFVSVQLNQDWPNKIGLRGVGAATFPGLYFEGANATLSGDLARMGNELTGDNPNGSTVVADDFSWIKGSHNLRFGFEVRKYYFNHRNSNGAGSYWFHSENTSQPGFVGSSGFSYASFLLGAIHRSDLSVTLTFPGSRVTYQAFYFQDDWKVTPNFTLNYGIRWEIPGAWKETADRMAGLDPSKPNPGAGNIPGALVWMGDCNGCTGRDSFQNGYYRQFAPRLGFAWSPNRTWVVRGGYGINYSPPIRDGFGFPFAYGFNGSNPINPQTGRFALDPSLSWDAGYPAFTDVLPKRDPTLQNRKGVNWLPADSLRMPYVQNWNIGIQYELPWEILLDANYVGNKGTRLHNPLLGQFINQVPSKFLSLGDALLEPIDKHPQIKKPFPGFTGTVARALRPFPQFEGVNSVRYHSGLSSYNALHVTATKRTTSGLSFLASYAYSKNLSDSDDAVCAWCGGQQDFYNRAAEKSPTDFWRPHQFRLTWIYDLPWGPGRRWLTSNVLGKVIGGWTLSGIHEYQSGGPLRIGAGGFTGSALFNPGFRADVVLPGDQQVIYSGGRPDSRRGTPYLNPAAFAKPPATPNNVAVRFGNAPRILPNVRGPANFVESLAMMKRTPVGLGEDVELEIRVDFINPFNRAGTGGPNTNISDPNFGRIFGNGLPPRFGQLGLRLNF